ncbi:MAG: hypothetical protein Q9P14_06805 [candidate division KSB1 bacterium]|nr:hypothetical protein [candidate division KSB1 bacterium]
MRSFLKGLAWLLLGLLILMLTVLLPAFFRHFVTFPQLERELRELQLQRRQARRVIPLQDYKGVLHAHSYWSHDSRGVLAEIITRRSARRYRFHFFYRSSALGCGLLSA